MASPKPYASVCSDELSEVQVLDSDEPLVTASSSTPSRSSARVMDSIEPLVPTVRIIVRNSLSPDHASDSQEPLVRSSNIDSGDLRPEEPVAGPSGMARRVVEARSSVGSSVSSPDLPSDSEFEDHFIPVPVQPSGSSGRRSHLHSAEIRSMWNWKKICTKLGSKEKCVKFAEERGLLPTSKMCTYHKAPMTLTRDAGQVGKFRCRKSKCRTKSVSRAIGTWFEDARLSIVQIFAIMYCFVEGLSYTQTQKELVSYEEDEEKNQKTNQVVSSRTIADWFNFCRQAVSQHEMETQRAQGKIGGPNNWSCEVSWRRRMLESHLDPYEELINAIKYVYK